MTNQLKSIDEVLDRSAAAAPARFTECQFGWVTRARFCVDVRPRNLFRIAPRARYMSAFYIRGNTFVGIHSGGNTFQHCTFAIAVESSDCAR
jgi:hypothetical protein